MLNFSEETKIILTKICSVGSVTCFALAAIAFVLAVVAFFLFRIPNVIGDLSGKNAQRSIAQLREINEKSGSKAYRTSETNAKRGKLTGMMEESGKLKKKNDKSGASKKTVPKDDNPETGLLESNVMDSRDVQGTELLENTDETDLLDDVKPTLKSHLTRKPVRREGGKKLKMIDDVMLIHTDEVIL